MRSSTRWRQMRFNHLRRREFITLLGGVAATWPLTAEAQQSGRIRRIGMLVGLDEDDVATKTRLAGFQQEFERLGWSEGSNVHIEYRYAPAASANRAQVLAKELVALQPDVILAQTPPVAVALQRETRTIPIVFLSVGDPIGLGLIASLARPGGNLTGLMTFEASVTGKWLAMLKEFAPRLTRAAFLADPKTTTFDYYLQPAEGLALSLAIVLVPTPVENAAADIERAIESFVRMPNGGLVVLPNPTCGARDLRPARIRRGRRSHVLRDRSCRRVSAGGTLCRPHLARCQTCRPSSAGADKVRNDHQPQDCKGARPHRPARPTRGCRRGDRVRVQPFVAAQLDNHCEARFGSKPAVTAPQHWQPLRLSQRTLGAEAAMPGSVSFSAPTDLAAI
jgi:putative ABC transport system substrate-binding protein